MSVIISDCIGCIHLEKAKTDRVRGTIKMMCKAFPEGIPADFEPNETEECGNGFKFELNKIYCKSTDSKETS